MRCGNASFLCLLQVFAFLEFILRSRRHKTMTSRQNLGRDYTVLFVGWSVYPWCLVRDVHCSNVKPLTIPLQLSPKWRAGQCCQHPSCVVIVAYVSGTLETRTECLPKISICTAQSSHPYLAQQSPPESGPVHMPVLAPRMRSCP